MGRAHRPFFRICAMDKRSPRDGRVLEELGTYDPMVSETDARAIFKKDRVDYWLSVGAQPSEKVAVLIKKYGTDGTHATAQQAAMDRLAMGREVPDPGAPASLPKSPEPEAPAAEAPKAEAPAAEEAAAEASAGEEAKPEEAAAEAPAAEAPAAEEAAVEAPPEEAKSSE
jgi:small subunit ribosomal protein S16